MIVRILATGDIHGDVGFIERIANEADKNKVDVIILAGDIADWHGPTDNLIGPLLGKYRSVCIVPGNHDTFASADMMAEQYGIVNLHNGAYQIDDVALFGCGGANVGLEQMHEEEIFTRIAQSHEPIKHLAKRIMVTHVHPSGSLMQSMSSFVRPSDGVKRAIDMFSPDLLLCCHVHEASGIEEKIGSTRVINVSRTMTILDL